MKGMSQSLAEIILDVAKNEVYAAVLAAQESKF